MNIISRLGCSQVRTVLPPLVRAVRDAGLSVLWMCDPMHGNTRLSVAHGLKTRAFDDILEELTETHAVHTEIGTLLGGVHFELTAENVTECTGGPDAIGERTLNKNYTSYCDPRLNYRQSIQMAFCIAKLLEKTRSSSTVPAVDVLDDP